MDTNKHEFVLLDAASYIISLTTPEARRRGDDCPRLLHRSVASLAAAEFFDCG